MTIVIEGGTGPGNVEFIKDDGSDTITVTNPGGPTVELGVEPGTFVPIKSAIPTNATPNEYWVSKGTKASDANSGDQYSPFSTIAEALTTIGAIQGALIHLGWGTWAEQIVSPPNGTVFKGISNIGSIIQLTVNNSILVDETGCAFVHLEDLQLNAASTAPICTLLNRNSTFNCYTKNVYFSGQHTAATGSTYHAQVGWTSSNNAGDNWNVNPFYANLGIAFNATTIQNGEVSPKASNCWEGFTTSGGGGIAITGYAIALGNASSSSSMDYGVLALGTGQHWIEQLWTEKINIVNVQVGSNSGTPAGPSQFAIGKSYLGDHATFGLDVQCCVSFEAESLRLGAQTTLLRIDPVNAPIGTVLGMDAATGHVTYALFPSTWNVTFSAVGYSQSSSRVGLQYVPSSVGLWYPNPIAVGQRAIALTLNRTYGHLYFSGPTPITIDKMDCTVTIVGTASTCRMGLWLVTNQSQPFQFGSGIAYASLILDAGAVATTGLGQIVNTLGTPQVIPPYTWFLVTGTEQGTASSTRDVAGQAGGSASSPFGNVAAQSYGSAPALSINMDAIIGALPNTFTPSGSIGIAFDGGVGIHRSA